MFTPIRVVCNNNLSLALEAKTNKFTIRHTKTANAKLEQAKQVLGLVDKQTLAYQEAFGKLASIKVSDDDAKLIIQNSLKIKNNEKGELNTRGKNIMEDAWTYYHIGLGQKDIVGNGWGLFNGITGYMQNTKSYRDSEAKFNNVLVSNDVRQTAFESIMNL